MSNLSQLIRNENMKIYRRPRTWIMIGFLLLAVALVSGIMKWDSSRDYHNDWQQHLAQENEYLQQRLQSGEQLDQTVVERYNNQIKLNQYYMEQQINPMEQSLWGYVDISTSLIVLVTILTVIIAADMIAAEFSWGTIKLLLVGPASRSKIMLSKYIATMGYALLLLFILLASSYVAGGALEGFDGTSRPLVTVNAEGAIQESSMLTNVLQKYGYAVISLVMYVTMAFMISAAFRSSSMAIAFSLLFIMIGNSLSAILSKYSWVKYLLFSNTDLTQYMAGATPLRPEMTLSFSIMMLVAYYILFQFIAWLLFTKRDVAA